MLDAKLSKLNLFHPHLCGESHLQRMRSYNITPCYPCAAGSAIRSHFSEQHCLLSHFIVHNAATQNSVQPHTHISCPPPIRRNNLNVKQVPSWSGPHSPSFEKFGLWCFCQVAIVLSDTHGNKRTMCNLDLIITSVLHCYLHFLYQGGEEMLILDGSFLWVVITVIKNARETPGEPGLGCSLTCCIINTELMSYFM